MRIAPWWPPRHRRQPTRLPRPWDSPDKNTGAGCHLLLQGIFRILGDASDPWVCTAVLASQATLLTVSQGGVIGLWSSATGTLHRRQRLSSIKEDTLACGVSVQKRGMVVTGSSTGSISLVSTFSTSPLVKPNTPVHLLLIPLPWS